MKNNDKFCNGDLTTYEQRVTKMAEPPALIAFPNRPIFAGLPRSLIIAVKGVAVRLPFEFEARRFTLLKASTDRVRAFVRLIEEKFNIAQRVSLFLNWFYETADSALKVFMI